MPEPKNHYCTYFDNGFLSRGIALHESLQRHDPGSTLWVLCFDSQTETILRDLADSTIKPIPIKELEQADPELCATQKTRSRVEYYFTCTPAWILHVLNRSRAQRVTYVDADLYFFGPPKQLFDEAPTANVLIHGHRFPRHLKGREIYGKFNVGLVSFRQSGLECLEQWRDQCIQWCYDALPGDGRFADQGYLNNWPTMFPGVHVIAHSGCGVAPWNLANHPIAPGPNGDVQVNGQRLIFFHFTGLRRQNGSWFRTGLHQYWQRMSRSVNSLVYAPYARRLIAIEDEMLPPLETRRRLRQPSRPSPIDWLLSPLRFLKRAWFRDSRRWLP